LGRKQCSPLLWVLGNSIFSRVIQAFASLHRRSGTVLARLKARHLRVAEARTSPNGASRQPEGDVSLPAANSIRGLCRKTGCRNRPSCNAQQTTSPQAADTNHGREPKQERDWRQFSLRMRRSALIWQGQTELLTSVDYGILPERFRVWSGFPSESELSSNP